MCISRGLEDASEDDLLLMSDVDEIPAPWVIEEARQGKLDLPVVCHQRLFYYDFGCEVEGGWNGTIITRADVTGGTIQHLRNVRNDLPKIGTGEAWPFAYAGWHLSYFGGADRVRSKLSAFAHQEYNTAENQDHRVLHSRRQRCIDPLGRDFVVMRQPAALVDLPVLDDALEQSFGWVTLAQLREVAQ
jgi:beta-1,4-mannosyl-glycoprotein beta-1,4-N-acetylglucosaminyltransferase